MGQRVFEALATHFAGQADLLGLARRPTLLREKRLWVRLRAQCALLPAQRTLLGAARLVHVAVPPRPALLKNPLVRHGFAGRTELACAVCTCHPLHWVPPGCAATHLSTAPPDQQKTANDIGEITCLSIP